MAMALQSGENSRYTDLIDEPVDHLLSPIRGYEDEPLVSLNEAVTPISAFFNGINEFIYVALHNCRNPVDGLDQQESASIYLYTMQFYGGQSLYLVLNQSLRSENREELKPWFSYMKLFLTALYKLPSQTGTVWRGVKNVDLTSKYKKGTKFAWWGVSSCTTDIEVLRSEKFLGKHGLRTLFSIDCINGKSIENHSHFKTKEKEIILMPGSYFEVIGQLNPAPELYIIQLKEIPSPIPFIKPPFSTSATINSSSVVNQSNIISQSISRRIGQNVSSIVNQLNIISQSTSNKIEQNVSSNIISKEISLKTNPKWKQFGITIAGGNGRGNKLDQLYNPFGIFIDGDQTIYIADCYNHRIVEWKSNATNGRVVAGGNGCGNQTNQFNGPTDVIIDKENNSLIISDRGNRRVMRWSRQNNTNGQIIIEDIDCSRITMDKNGSLYVSDYKKNEVRRWKRGEKKGKVVAGGNNNGNNLNQFNGPTFIFVDDDYSLYVSDSGNHRVMKWLKHAKEGIIVAGGNDQGNSLAQLSSPAGITVDQFGQIYVADCHNHRVMRWCQGAKEGSIVVSGSEEGQLSDQFHRPTALSIDRQGNLFLVDWWNDRIQKFEID